MRKKVDIFVFYLIKEGTKEKNNQDLHFHFYFVASKNKIKRESCAMIEYKRMRKRQNK